MVTMNQPNSNEESALPELPDILPVLPLKEVVVFPFIIMPLSVGTDRSVVAIDHALAGNRMVMLVTQRDSETDEPTLEQLHSVGTVALIMRMLKLPDGRIRILVQGLQRARIANLSQMEPFLQARIEPFPTPPPTESNLEIEARLRDLKEQLEKALHLGKGVSPEVMVVAANLDDPGRLADLAASNLDLRPHEAQDILETIDPAKRLQAVNEYLHREVELLNMQHEISSQARDEIDRNQREYFLRQQLRAIQNELGDGDEFMAEVAEYRQRAEDIGLTDEAAEELEKQLKRLEKSHPESAENGVIRNYLDWLTGLPWSRVSKDRLDLDQARTVLDEDHYGLDEIKQRIIEFLAVRKLKADSKGPILCFVGPPGVGKTSLGRSIARALDRQFIRLSLGGVRDEAEIRGHRRTYVGAMPGRILQGLHRAGTNNPVFMLDEIDKIGADYRGDPSSALLEVLDPEQNSTFRDHYLGLSYDLSRVIFITTANLLDPIQPAFRDRMEIIRLSGYSEEEKVHIARRHLIPKQLSEHGLQTRHLSFSQPAIRKIIRGYTREAGLRNLEREIATLCRKVAVKVATGKTKPVKLRASRVETFLGNEKHFQEALLNRHRVGIATGLAWTAAGGDLMIIEAVAVPGKGRLLLTGQLGEVMKESGQTAMSYARSYAHLHGLGETFFRQHDIHIHAPAGSIPKDGPSAGITIATAIVSVLTGQAIDRSLAMTGEITLRGEILPIGGLKEKILAARVAGIETLVIPHPNKRDLRELPASLTRGMTLHFPKEMEEVLRLALLQVSKKKPRHAASAR